MARRPKEITFSWTRVESWDDRQVETECTVTATVDGKYRPMRWGPDGGSPEEFPEVDVVAVVVDETGADITEDMTKEENQELQTLAEYEAGEAEADAYNDEMERRSDEARGN